MVPRAEILETEVEWLHSIKADFVVILILFIQQSQHFYQKRIHLEDFCFVLHHFHTKR